MIHIAFQCILVICVVVFIIYVFYHRYRDLQLQNTLSQSETYRNATSSQHTSSFPQKTCTHPPTIESHVPNGQVCGSPVPPLSNTSLAHAKQLLYKTGDVEQQYPPVWIPVSTHLSKVLNDYTTSLPMMPANHCAMHNTASIPDFADVFRGYQRLALLTIYMTFGQKHKIIFVHKGNWHTFLPNLAGACSMKPHFRSDAMNESMRMDYVKANLLAYYGGYWIPPDTVIMHHQLHTFITKTLIKQARKQNDALVDTPLLVVAKKHELHTNAPNTLTIDASWMFAEPRNPTMLAMANQMQVIVTRSFNNSSYEYNNYFENTLYQYKYSGEHPNDAPTILALPPSVNGAIDDRGHPVTADHYFRQRPLEHLPHPDACWCVVNSADNRISHYPMYDWFVYLSEEAIVQNQMWIALVFRRGLQIDSTQTGNNYRTTISLQEQNHPLRLMWTRSWKMNLNK